MKCADVWPPSGFNLDTQCSNKCAQTHRHRHTNEMAFSFQTKAWNWVTRRYLRDEWRRTAELNQSFRQLVWMQNVDEPRLEKWKIKGKLIVQIKMCVSLQSNFCLSIWRVHCIWFSLLFYWKTTWHTRRISQKRRRIQKNAKWNFNDADDRFSE